MNIAGQIKNRIEKYQNNGQVAGFFLDLLEEENPGTRDHSCLTALFAEETAKKFGLDPMAAFFAGLFHHAGRILFAYEIIDNCEFTDNSFDRINSYIFNLFKSLCKQPDIGLVAGVHYGLREFGFDITLPDLTNILDTTSTKQILETSNLIAVCEHIQNCQREITKDRVIFGKETPDLQAMALEKFPQDEKLVLTALQVAEKYLQE